MTTEQDTIAVIRKALGNYTMIHQICADDPSRSLELVDVVTPSWENSIKVGEDELDRLAEHVCGYLIESNAFGDRISLAAPLADLDDIVSRAINIRLREILRTQNTTLWFKLSPEELAEVCQAYHDLMTKLVNRED